uniref:Centrosomal protein 152 n=1 Tax=Scophthalmus maximus TaxID=52904 RepID=A0A8D3AHA6_SCOMX
HEEAVAECLLHKLLTDLPDDMLEDSRDSSSPELEYSTCSNKNPAWTQQWSNHPEPISHEQNYEADYDRGGHDEYTYEDGADQINGQQRHAQSQPLPHTWNQPSEDHQFTQGDYTYTSMGTEKSTETNEFSTEYEAKPYSQGTDNHLEYNGEGGYRVALSHGDHTTRNHFQVKDNVVNQYQATYNPHHPANQPKMFIPQAAHQGGQFDPLQREFLDSTQQTADREQLAQLQILNKAHQRQMEDLERKLEDSRRNMRYIEHQFAIVKDERDGLAVSLKESSRLVEESKEREVQMQNKVKAMEQQIQVLTERDNENTKKQRVAEAAVDSMKQQMLELCRSDTLSRSREQHDRDLTVIREQHEVVLLALEQKLDSTGQALNEQIDVCRCLREQVKQLECQREEEQLERARVINGLTQRLEESQHQCAKLLQTCSVQEMSQVQIKLQQSQSAKALSENMNKVLQDLADLKEQITLYESAVKHGVIALDLSNDWENQLSESCVDLGLKKTSRKNGTLHSTALAHLSESKLPKDEALRLLRVEMQRCLGSLKGKGQKINQLQEELQRCQRQVNELHTQLDEAKLSSSVREKNQIKHPDVSGESQKELLRLKEQVEVLEKNNKELKQGEVKLRSVNSELCTKMREMIQELDQEKQEAAQRAERIHQQYRDDVVNQVKTELMLEHDAQLEELTAQHQQQVQQLQTHLSEANDKMLAVQECYLSVCKEKDMLEERMDNRQKEMDRTWTKKLEAAGREKHRETAEATCQTDEIEGSSVTISPEELDSRLDAQKQQLQLEADKVTRKAAVDARKHAQRELQEKHLDDMAKQVEGAVTRAYNRWIEDLPSLPEYQASLQAEREKWEELQENFLEQRVSQSLREAEEQWHKKHRLEEQSSGVQRSEELQEELATLQSQLEQGRREQAALLKAELAGARAAWNRDKQQEISAVQVRSEQAYQTKLQEQHKKLERALEQARADADLEKNELLQQTEAKFQEALRAREEEWRCWHAEKEVSQRRQMRDELIAELQTGMAEVQAASESTAETTTTHLIQTSCKDIVSRAISQAKKEWKKISEERLSCVLKETQEQHEREIDKIRSKKTRCRKECADNFSKLQKKNQELQRHLEKACRQLQHSFREHKTTTKTLKGIHNISCVSECQSNNTNRFNVLGYRSSDHQQNLHQGLEEMKQQYLMTVERIREDMLRYLQDSRDRAAEMIRMEVQRERQDTARKMRHYYLTCLQEILEDGGKIAGAEKKIIYAASKLAAMAKVLETPIKSKTEKNYSLTSEEKTSASSQQKQDAAARTKPYSDTSASGKEAASVHAAIKPQVTAHTNFLSSKPSKQTPSSHQTPSPSQVNFVSVSVRGKSRERHLQGGASSEADDHLDSERQSKPFLIQAAPVRDEKRTDWSVTSIDSDTGFQVPRLSYSGRKVEPVKPFSVSASVSASDFREFGGLSPDTSDLTVYNDIVKNTPQTQNLNFPSVKTSKCREPTPGSEAKKQQGACPRPLFSELRQRHQDSGFDIIVLEK